MGFRLLMGLWLTVTAPSWAGEEPGQEELENTIARVDLNMNPDSAEYFLKIINEVPGKDPEEYILYTAYHHSDKWAAIITVPGTLKGRTFLRVGHQVWYHVPGELTPRTNPLHHSPVNGTLDFQTLFRIHDLPHYRPQLLEFDDSRLAVELHPRIPSDNLPLRYMVINRVLDLPQSETIFSASKTPLKEISYLDVRQFGTLPPRPAKIVVKSLINTGYSTTITLGWVKHRQVPEESFTLPFLPRVGTLLKSSGE